MKSDENAIFYFCENKFIKLSQLDSSTNYLQPLQVGRYITTKSAMKKL